MSAVRPTTPQTPLVIAWSFEAAMDQAGLLAMKHRHRMSVFHIHWDRRPGRQKPWTAHSEYLSGMLWYVVAQPYTEDAA